MSGRQEVYEEGWNLGTVRPTREVRWRRAKSPDSQVALWVTYPEGAERIEVEVAPSRWFKKWLIRCGGREWEIAQDRFRRATVVYRGPAGEAIGHLTADSYAATAGEVVVGRDRFRWSDGPQVPFHVTSAAGVRIARAAEAWKDQDERARVEYIVSLDAAEAGSEHLPLLAALIFVLPSLAAPWSEHIRPIVDTGPLDSDYASQTLASKVIFGMGVLAILTRVVFGPDLLPWGMLSGATVLAFVGLVLTFVGLGGWASLVKNRAAREERLAELGRLLLVPEPKCQTQSFFDGRLTWDPAGLKYRGMLGLGSVSCSLGEIEHVQRMYDGTEEGYFGLRIHTSRGEIRLPMRDETFVVERWAMQIAEQNADRRSGALHARNHGA